MISGWETEIPMLCRVGKNKLKNKLKNKFKKVSLPIRNEAAKITGRKSKQLYNLEVQIAFLKDDTQSKNYKTCTSLQDHFKLF